MCVSNLCVNWKNRIVEIWLYRLFSPKLFVSSRGINIFFYEKGSNMALSHCSICNNKADPIWYLHELLFQNVLNSFII